MLKRALVYCNFWDGVAVVVAARNDKLRSVSARAHVATRRRRRRRPSTRAGGKTIFGEARLGSRGTALTHSRARIQNPICALALWPDRRHTPARSLTHSRTPRLDSPWSCARRVSRRRRRSLRDGERRRVAAAVATTSTRNKNMQRRGGRELIAHTSHTLFGARHLDHTVLRDHSPSSPLPPSPSPSTGESPRKNCRDNDDNSTTLMATMPRQADRSTAAAAVDTQKRVRIVMHRVIDQVGRWPFAARFASPSIEMRIVVVVNCRATTTMAAATSHKTRKLPMTTSQPASQRAPKRRALATTAKKSFFVCRRAR